MPLAPVMVGTGLTGTGSHPYCLFIDGLDVIKQPGTPGSVFGTDIDSVTVQDVRGQTPIMEFTIDDPSGALSFRGGADVYFCDHRGRRFSDGSWHTGDLFRGFLTQVTKKLMGAVAVQWDCVALGLDALLDRKIFSEGLLPAGTDTVQAIQQVAAELDGRLSALAYEPNNQSVSGAAGRMIHDDPAFHLRSAHFMAGKTARQVLSEISQDSVSPTSVWYQGDLRDIVDVDVQGRLRWLFEDAPNSVHIPTIREGTSATTPAPSRIQAQTDTDGLVNAVWVRGVDNVSSGAIVDGASVALYGRYEAFIDAAWSTSLDSSQAAGQAFLSQHKPISRIQFQLSAAHDLFFPTQAANYYGWNTGRRGGLDTTSGLWTNGTYTLHEINWSFRGGGTTITLDLGFSGGASRGTSRLAQGRAMADSQERSAGRLQGGLDEVAIRVKAGTPTDADFAVPRDGFVVVDTSASKIWTRVSGTWKGVTVA